METIKLLNILKDHCIDCKKENGKVYALEVFDNGESWINVTDYSLQQLKNWLGY